MINTSSSDEDAARQELSRLVHARASGEDILAVLTPLEPKAVELEATVPVGETPDAEFWKSRAYTDGRGFEALLNYLDDAAADYAKGTLREDRRAVLIIGPPAAGKSTIAEQIARAVGAAIVDPDDAKTQIPEYDDGKGAATVHHETGLLAIYVLARFLKRGANVILPKTGGSFEMTARLLQILKRADYAVTVIHISVSFDETVRRMAHRFLECGRIVQADYIREVGTRSRDTFAQLKEKGSADGFIEIDAEDFARQHIAGSRGDIWPDLNAALEQACAKRGE